MYLIASDYNRVIQLSELNAITNSTPSYRQLAEQSVQTQIFSYLMQRFDVSSEFTDTVAWAFGKIYKGNNRVYLDATAYNAANTYALNALTLYNGAVYFCSTAIVAPEAFNIVHWTLLGNQYDMFFITLPQPAFNVDTVYYKLDKVFWKDSVYTAAQDSIGEDQQDALQAPSIESIQFGNTLPDDRFNGKRFWGTGVPYSVAAGTLPTNTTYWTKGDNRNQRFVTIFCDMVVYDLSKRITPNNVPEMRHNNWLKACKDLSDYAKGNLNAQLPIIQPKTGQRVQFGGIPPKMFDM